MMLPPEKTRLFLVYMLPEKWLAHLYTEQIVWELIHFLILLSSVAPVLSTSPKNASLEMLVLNSILRPEWSRLLTLINFAMERANSLLVMYGSFFSFLNALSRYFNTLLFV